VGEIDIVVNYRTADEAGTAALIDRALTERIGDRVFRDCRRIGAGQDFAAEIWAAVRQCRILVAVIGERWAGPGDGGRRRIDDPADFVRREIAMALERQIRVVPVLVGAACLPDPEHLPEDLQRLALCQHRTLRLRDLENDVECLADEMVALLNGPSSAARNRPTEARPTVVNEFRGPVEASCATFGVSINGGG
jgi:hypothetical protein